MRSRRPAVALAALLAACAAESTPEPETPGGVSGRVGAAVGDFPSVVLLTPGSAPEAAATPDGPLVIDQLGMQFSPERLLVPIGATVRFTNSEVISHNVRLRIPEEPDPILDEDTDPGASLAWTFTTSGPVGVTCATHPGMRSFIFVHDAPYAAFAETDGSFEIGVPPGTYRLEVWSDDEELRSSRQIEVPDSGARILPAPGG